MPLLGDAGLVAAREIRERVRGKVFRIGTLLILLAVAAAIVIPKLDSGSQRPQYVGVSGTLATPVRDAVVATGTHIGTRVQFVQETSMAQVRDDLRSGRVDLAIVGSRELVVEKAIKTSDTSATANLVRVVSEILGAEEAYSQAGLSAAQATRIAHAKPLPVVSVHTAPKGVVTATSVIGVILIFLMLTQYNMWTLYGVMEEKSSRVVEVLLAAVRPLQLLTGKVLGIGLVAFGQAALIIVVALGLARAVGSDLLHGTGPLELASALLWLALGYGFYCWVYAAAGSTAERQDQIQALAFPLSIPMILGYVTALTVASSGNTNPFFDVLSYLPPTAPFAMPILVGLGKVTWWEFAASVGICVVGIVVMARVAAGIYRRSILRTGRRVGLREVTSRAAG
jgi:ABC-2 type transport system permease protein